MARTYRTALAALTFSLAGSLAGAAVAADLSDGTAAAPFDYGDTDLVIELGIGGLVSPDYDGSDHYEVSPMPIVSVEYLNLPGIGAFGGKDGLGFSIGPSFGYVGERDSGDYRDLEGLDDVDATYEAGIKLGYEWRYADVYGELRYAFGGAEGFVGDIGADLIARPTETLTLKAGPVASFASSEYMDGYFGISSAEAAATGGRLAAYDPDGGFKSVGVAASARYEIFTDWFVTSEASWQRLVGDAADSPIVDAGDDDQYSFNLGISRRFSLDLF